MRVSDVERWLEWLFVAAEGAGLRQEDRRKAREVAAMLDEVERALSRFARHSPMVLVDAAAGKSYVGLLAARLVLDPSGRKARVMTLERDPRRVESSIRAIERLGTGIPIECHIADVENVDSWPKDASIIMALHACGSAADAIIDRTIQCRARMLLLVPCCTSNSMDSAARARRRADDLGIPRHAHVRRRFIQALVDSERTWRLEAAGYETEVVEFVPPTITPHNLLWRARLVREPGRMAAAGKARAKL
jgi:hypothetical protein